MKKYIILIYIFISVGVLFAQDKIPRRIIINFESLENKADIISMLPDILNARINDIHTIIPVKFDQKYHNKIDILVQGNVFSFILYKGLTFLDKQDFIIEELNLLNIEKTCIELADLWKNYLDLADPFIEDIIVRERRELSVEALFEESLATVFQVSLWLSLFRNSLDGAEGTFVYDFLFPQIIDLDWYINTTWGVNFSFYFESSDFISFGRVEIPDVSSTTADSSNILLLPGIGLTFRSLGKISGNYGISLYLGPVYVYALDDILNSSPISITPFLSAGESTWIFFSYLSLKTGVSYNFNDKWSLKTRIVTFLSPLAIIDPGQQLTDYSSMERGSSFSLNIQLGLGYRW